MFGQDVKCPYYEQIDLGWVKIEVILMDFTKLNCRAHTTKKKRMVKTISSSYFGL